LSIENGEAQKKETTDRTDENLEYQANIANLQEADGLLKKAISVLKVYYSKIVKEEAFVEMKKTNSARNVERRWIQRTEWRWD